MLLWSRFLVQMSRLCGGGGVACGGGGVACGRGGAVGTKPQMGVVFRYGPPPSLHHHLSHAPFPRAPPPGRKKNRSQIQNPELSFDTFFTMKRLLERSRRSDEVLRWISQNPSKVSASLLVVALQRISQLLQAPPPNAQATPTQAEEGGAKVGSRKWTLEHRDFHFLCDVIEGNVKKLDNYSLVTSLFSAANIGLTSDQPLVRGLQVECLSRVPQFNQKDLSMVFSSVMRLQERSPPPSSIQVPDAQSEESPPPSAPTAPVGGALTSASSVGGAMTSASSVGGALTSACLSGLERSLERERHPQTLFLLLGFYRGRWRELSKHAEPREQSGQSERREEQSGQSERREEQSGQSERREEQSGQSERREEQSGQSERREDMATPSADQGQSETPAEEHGQSERRDKDTPPAATNQELLITNRKILRLVKHTLSCVSTVRDQEMALLDEMLAACVSEASNRSLELIFTSHLFHQNRQERFIKRLAEELPLKADALSVHTMALIAKYAARHRLRETRLLDAIADFLLMRAESLDTKVIQRLVFPFSRMNYSPHNAPVLWEKLEQVLEVKALSSPLATVNILMSLFQLRFCPERVLQKVFSGGFINDLTNSPYSLIVRRYLSLLDSAVDLEFRTYSGPRLNPRHKVLMFEQILTADEVNRKYSYKGLVSEALRQLVGENGYKQDLVLAPGYSTDFLLWMDSAHRVLPIGSSKPCDPSVTSGWSDSVLAADLQKFSLEAEPSEAALSVVGGASLHHMTSFYPTDQEVHRLVLSVNDKWHHCHNSTVLVGSRAMRERHLGLMGLKVIQLPYHDLEKLNGIEDVKKYLEKKLSEVELNQTQD